MEVIVFYGSIALGFLVILIRDVVIHRRGRDNSNNN